MPTCNIRLLRQSMHLCIQVDIQYYIFLHRYYISTHTNILTSRHTCVSAFLNKTCTWTSLRKTYAMQILIEEIWHTLSRVYNCKKDSLKIQLSEKNHKSMSRPQKFLMTFFSH